MAPVFGSTETRALRRLPGWPLSIRVAAATAASWRFESIVRSIVRPSVLISWSVIPRDSSSARARL